MPNKDKMQKKVEKVMREYKAGTLHSGKGGPVVKSREQAVAIAMSEGRKAGGYKSWKKSGISRGQTMSASRKS
jgi:hypothetical protein